MTQPDDDRAIQVAVIALLVLAIAAAVLLLGGCSLFPDLAGSDPSPKAGETTGAGPVHTTTALWWIGLGALVGGLAIAVGRTWVPLFPRGVGILTAASGFGAMWVADLLARHWWILPLVGLALIVLGVVEYLGRDRVVRWVKENVL